MKSILVAGYKNTCANYLQALRLCKTEPFLSLNPKQAASADGLLLPGGGDLDPSLFAQKNTASKDIDPYLDQKQLELLHAFVKEKKPVLGICKGMQVINVFFGGDLIQHLPSADAHQYVTGQADGDQIHEIISIATPYYGTRFFVNSAHHQGIGELGNGILPTQFALDGVIEGLRHSSLPVTGVQWHPERMCFSKKRNDTVDGAALLYDFILQL